MGFGQSEGKMGRGLVAERCLEERKAHRRARAGAAFRWSCP